MNRIVPTSSFSRASTKVALVAVFTALSLGTNYALIDLPNIKLMDALVFVSAFLFGLEVGLGVAIFSRLAYAVNPWGTAPADLLVFLIVGEMFYAIAGHLFSRTSLGNDLLKGSAGFPEIMILGMVGLISTFAFDVLTNFGSFVFITTSVFNALLIGMATGAPLAIVHEVSNIVFFATVGPVTITAGGRFLSQGR